MYIYVLCFFAQSFFFTFLYPTFHPLALNCLHLHLCCKVPRPKFPVTSLLPIQCPLICCILSCFEISLENNSLLKVHDGVLCWLSYLFVLLLFSFSFLLLFYSSLSTNSKSPAYDSSSCELWKMLTCVPSVSGRSEIAACSPSPLAGERSALPSATSTPFSSQ